MLKIGIIKEGKVPTDKRVAFTPAQCVQIQQQYPQLTIKVQSSDIRSYSDQEYEQAGISVVQDVTDCDILFGVKEVPVSQLIADKTYFFFSHTIKKQVYNKGLLQEVLRQGIQLVDYECLKNQAGQRVVAFGRFAGIVGAYNALWTYGQKHQAYALKRAYACKDREELFQELTKVKLPPLKIVLTGGGRVAKGAMEVLDQLGIKKVSTADYATAHTTPVYCQLESEDYNHRKDGQAFDIADFYTNPSAYESTFEQYFHSDLLIAAAYWDPKAPVLFSKEDMCSDAFNIQLIADITCDIEGSIPSTLRATTIDAPVYDLDLSQWEERVAFQEKDLLSVMAVDNLPCELSRDASESFGEQLMENALPALFGMIDDPIIEQASITKRGQLTEYFNYLEDYVA